MRVNRLIICVFTVLLLIVAVIVPANLDQVHDEIPIYILSSAGKNTEQINCWKNESNEYYVFLPSFSELSETKICLNADSAVSINGIKITDGMSCRDFEFNVPYTLEYSVFSKSHKCNITFVNSAEVASMHIDTKTGNMDYIHSKKGNEENGKLVVYNSDGSTNYSGNINSINGRGNNTWEGFDKKPYSIKLENEADLLGMGKAQKWILLANADDSSNLRNKIVYDFAKEVGLDYSPDSRWVDLYLNGEYAGLYLLCERNEVHTNRVDISKENGFLFSLEPEARLTKQKLTHLSTLGRHFLRVHYPSEISGSELQSVSQVWQSAENAIFADNGIDVVTKRNWQDLIDLESWAKKYLIEEVFGNLDGDMASQYFYIDKSDDNQKIYAGPVWDFDKALGNDNDSKWSVTNPETFVVSRYWGYYNENPQWFEKLYQKDEFKNKVIDLFENLFLPQTQILLNEKISVYEKEIARAAEINEIRWNNGCNTLDVELCKITDYLEKHTDFLNGVWLDNAEYCRVSFINLKNDLFYCIPLGDKLGQIPEVQNTDTSVFCGFYYLDTDEPFDISKPIYEDTAIYAKWQEKSGEKVKDILKLVPLAVISVLFVAFFVIDIKRNRVAKK